MSRLGMFACLLMLVAVAVCLDMPANMKAPEQPKEGGQIPQRPEGPRPDGPQAEGRPDLPKGGNPKSDAKAPQDGKS